MTLAKTPKPPYYAVIFSNTLTSQVEGYQQTAEKMVELAQQQDGFLGFESAREDIGLSISYWQDLDAIKHWKNQADHLLAQQQGIKQWYEHYITRIAYVERDYSFIR